MEKFRLTNKSRNLSNKNVEVIYECSYNRLWKQLIDKNMKRIEMQHLTGISANILARMGKNQYVSMETIEKICKKLDCTIDEIMEFTD